MNKNIKIGTRGSKLSLAYAEKVRKLLLKTKKSKVGRIFIKKIKTKGDIFNKRTISEIGGKNVFCKELEEQLSKKKIDIAIHSLKDMDSSERKKLIIGAYIKRNDPRDVLILNKKKKRLDKNQIILGSSSKRREFQIKNLHKNVTFKKIRGNVDTRVNKIKEGNFDGTILAMAGIKTLKLEKNISRIFNVKNIIPAAGQGIIAAQCRKKDKDIIKLLDKINDNKTKICALAERGILKYINGDCHTAVGVFAKIIGGKIKLTVRLFSQDGKHSVFLKDKAEVKDFKRLSLSLGKRLLKSSKNFLY